MSAFKCFESYVKDKGLPEDMEQHLLEEYTYISYSLEGNSISDEKALELLGDYTFCEGVERAILHCDVVRETDDGREVFMEQNWDM